MPLTPVTPLNLVVEGRRAAGLNSSLGQPIFMIAFGKNTYMKKHEEFTCWT
jgi:hypothetical protein